MNPSWRALAREAGIAAEHIAIGATALGNANYAHPGYYGQAFFALSIGFERSGKLALLVDHALDHSGTFPDSQTLRGYGHDLRRLFSLLENIAHRRGVQPPNNQLPRTPVHDAIIEILSDFARNLTRYYNLDFVAGDPQTVSRVDPVAAWFQRVRTPILAKHYRERQRTKHELNARVAEELMGHISLIRHQAETGEPITSAYEASLRTATTEAVQPWERMYVLQIARFVAAVVGQLGNEAQRLQLPSVPYLRDFFAIYLNNDADFRTRKRWSIYP